MAKVKGFPSLRQVLLNLILFRLFLPLLVLGLAAIVGVAYLGEQDLEIQQYHVAQSMAQIVDSYLDQGGRILDAVARVAESPGTENLSIFMENTWEAYRYFDTLYYLDEADKIKLMIPYNPHYLGLDMSNLPDFQQAGEKKGLIISRPFISLRTGEPTVNLVRHLSCGGCVVGELNLGLFQQEITRITSKPGKDFIFIVDQSGTLLAHPYSELVKQQTNLSNLEIFHRSMAGMANAIYLYNGIRVLGSAAPIERTGWVVVDQVTLTALWGSYAWTLVLILLASLAIWLTLVWNLRKQLQRYVTTPLEKLSRETNALTVGDYSQANSLSSIPTAFAELNKLAADFVFMVNSLRERETALEEANAMMEEEIMELNRAEAELIKAKEAADIANIGKSNFISNISHELRTPIAVILSAIQLIEMNIRNDEVINQQNAGNHVRTMKQNCYRLLRLVNNIIDVTKIDAGFMKLRLKNINIVGLVEDMTTSIVGYAKGKGIKVLFDTDEEEIIMAVDPDKMERILLNLFSNAIKFTQRNGNIFVSINNQKTEVVISVEDTGIGIPEGKKDLIFERFQQIDDTFTRKNEGSGIGLSIVKAFVELHGGCIIVSSELGKGSKFVIELPVKILDNDQIKQEPVKTEISMHYVDVLNIEFSDIYI